MKYTEEELELMSYDDLAESILEESKEPIKISELFRKIADMMKLTDAEYEDKIEDFFEILSIDKRFTILEKGFCDLSIRHSKKIVIEDDEDEDYIDVLETVAEEDSNADENLFDEDTAPDEDEAEDDLKDLIVVDDEEDEIDDIS